MGWLLPPKDSIQQLWVIAVNLALTYRCAPPVITGVIHFVTK
jgi:hypothetical protein